MSPPPLPTLDSYFVFGAGKFKIVDTWISTESNHDAQPSFTDEMVPCIAGTLFYGI